MLNIILNPMSGEGKKKKLHRRALARFAERKAEFRVFETENPDRRPFWRTIFRRKGAISS